MGSVTFLNTKTDLVLQSRNDIPVISIAKRFAGIGFLCDIYNAHISFDKPFENPENCLRKIPVHLIKKNLSINVESQIFCDTLAASIKKLLFVEI